MKIIAKQDNNIFIEFISPIKGRVVNLDSGYIGPIHNIVSILRRGYWEEFSIPEEIFTKEPSNVS